MKIYMNISVADLEPKIKEAANLMGLLSQPARLRILCILLEGERSVLALADVVDMSQPAISHHLKKLRIAGLVQTRRDAQTIFYSLKSREVEEILSTLHRLYCA